MLDVHAIGLKGNASALDAKIFQDTQVDKIGGGLDQDDVSRITQCFGDQVEELLAAMSDQNLRWVVGFSFGGHLVQISDAPGGQDAQVLATRARSILEDLACLGLVLCPCMDDMPGLFDREGLGIGKTCSERDEVRALEFLLHQPCDGRWLNGLSPQGKSPRMNG